ncbi:MAG: hypothetical protein E6076_03655 [Peptoniphilus harei]|uniref:hypothetical protein n=1 Tax=Peptoniphilus harei TaxID=54005 RepID=UPI00290C2B54|nr:hypothetical protein [Peptoniphilus harei]MDU5470918.1 hypothetical protein [Peptoniphilus harei]MDU6099032.1 hypothetical protein [Peptoniphilus harei]
MNKKLTSLSLAGVMLLSTASPVFAEVTEAVKDVKEPTKMEKVLEEGKEKVAKAEEKAEEKVAPKLEEVKEAIKKELAKEKEVTESEAFKKADDKVKSNYLNAVAAGKSIVEDEKATLEQANNELKALVEAAEKVGLKADAKVEEMKDAKKEMKTIDVKATNQKVKLDGKDVVISGYNIDGYNYFKLRDLAAVLKDSQAKFGVDYKDGVVTLTKAADYKVVESDQKPVKAESKGMLTNDKVLVGDKTLTATAYKIDDLNYYKLRDLGKELGFGVGYDEATKSVLLTSVVNEKEEVKEEKVAPKLEEVKEAINKELAKEKEVRASEEYKKATDEVKTNYENAIAAGKNIVADKDATLEQANNELKALVEAGEKIGLKAEAKIEEKAEKGKKEIKKDVKEGKEEVKETAKEVK